MRPNTTKLDLPDTLHYCNCTGKLFWVKNKGNSQTKKEAGYKSKNGYISIRINKRLMYAHRIVWLIHKGKWPNKYIDHIDGDRQNNKIQNLREVSHRENNINKEKHRNGHLPGTTWEEVRKKWRASTQISVNGNRKTVYLGRFETQKQAAKAYRDYHKNNKV